jgi:YbbR domain-containing protein
LYVNLSSLILAFLLAVVVWVSAVVAADPNEENVYPQPINLEITGQDPELVLSNSIPSQVRLTVNAPRSIWSRLISEQGVVRAWIDISGLEAGQYIVPVKVQIGLTPHKVVKVEPGEVTISLEPLLASTLDVDLKVTGEPALGYRKGQASVNPRQVAVSGPVSLVSTVASVEAQLDISDLSETIRKEVTLQPLDEKGEVVKGVTVTPPVVPVVQMINLLGGYRNVVVKVVTSGQVTEGYWLTNIIVTPPNVTVFSTDPQLVNELPGFVETEPVDLTGLKDDVDIRVTLDLPEDVTLAGEESVLVRLSIASLEGSLPISLPLEIVGLSPELVAVTSPEQVDVLITGPLPILNNLTPGGIRVSINLAGLLPGKHQVVPEVDLLPTQLKVASILPESVEVTISYAPTPKTTQTTQPTLPPSVSPTPAP